MRPGGASAENAAMEEERNFERKIMNCTLVLLHTQDQIKELDLAVPRMKAREALKRLEMRRNELTEKQHSLETELANSKPHTGSLRLEDVGRKTIYCVRARRESCAHSSVDCIRSLSVGQRSARHDFPTPPLVSALQLGNTAAFKHLPSS